jgi:type III secretion protein L
MKPPLNRATVLALGRVDSARRVIRADQVRELEYIATSAVNAGQRIEEAEARCLADLDKTTHSAWQRGYARGHAEALDRLHGVLATLDDRRKSLETDLIDLVIDAIGRIVRGLPPELLTPGLITTALDEAQCDRGRLVLRVHPANAEVAERWLECHSPHASEHLRLTLEIDPSVAEDGCVLETPVGAIDAGLATQLSALREHLMQAAAANAHESSGALRDEPRHC